MQWKLPSAAPTNTTSLHIEKTNTCTTQRWNRAHYTCTVPKTSLLTGDNKGCNMQLIPSITHFVPSPPPPYLQREQIEVVHTCSGIHNLFSTPHKHTTCHNTPTCYSHVHAINTLIGSQLIASNSEGHQ